MKVYKQDGKFYQEDNGVVVELIPNKDYYVKLAPNTCNREWTSCKKVDAAPNQCIDYGDEVRVARVLGPYTNKKPLTSYLTDEERAIYDDLIAKCLERKKAEQSKPLSELEKLERRLKAATEAYEKALKASKQ